MVPRRPVVLGPMAWRESHRPPAVSPGPWLITSPSIRPAQFVSEASTIGEAPLVTPWEVPTVWSLVT